MTSRRPGRRSSSIWPTSAAFPRRVPGLENFEGMGFGPPLPDGSRTLLLVSDDNFSQRQRTTFLLFRLTQP